MRKTFCRLASLAATLLVGVALPSLAQPPAGSPPPASTQPPAGDATAPAGGMSGIAEILAGEEDLLSDSGFNYDPGNRRDPFKSLLRATERTAPQGARPEGIAGLLIDELDLTGVFKTSQGYVAQVQASNKEKSYLIREGDQLFDGDVVSITRNEVVFKQIVNDPTVIKPFREVVKKLSP